MKVSCSEGLATHTGSESCIFVGDGEDEALTGVRTGQVWSREIEPPSRKRWPLLGADVVELSGRQNWERRYRETLLDLARSETLGMHASTLSGNREIPSPSVRKSQTASESPRTHTDDVRAREVGQSHSTCETAEQSRG